MRQNGQCFVIMHFAIFFFTFCNFAFFVCVCGGGGIREGVDINPDHNYLLWEEEERNETKKENSFQSRDVFSLSVVVSFKVVATYILLLLYFIWWPFHETVNCSMINHIYKMSHFLQLIFFIYSLALYRDNIQNSL